MFGQVSSSADHGKEESLEASIAEGSEAERSGSAAEGAEGEGGEGEGGAGGGDAAHLVKLSYHDSGIDIRDPLLHVNTANKKVIRKNHFTIIIIYYMYYYNYILSCRKSTNNFSHQGLRYTIGN